MRNLDIKIKYKTYTDDVLTDFYIPVLSKSVKYYRAVGYFSSSIFIDYVKGLIEFIKNDGEIRLIISPYLTEQDYNELQNLKMEKDVQMEFINNIESLLDGDKKTVAASKLFVLLMNNGYLKVKVSKPLNMYGIFHEKIGVFIDKYDNKIAIIGSNNETQNAVNFNHESFNTFCSWKEGQQDYVNQHFEDFINIWEGNMINVDVKDIDKAMEEKLIKKYNIYETIDELIGIILDEDSPASPLGFVPYAHQSSAVESWMKNKKGILKFATGSGKTKTAIMIIDKLKQKEDKLLTIIVVPDKTLVHQWNDEIKKYSNYIINCFSDYDWEKEFLDLSYKFSDLQRRHQFIIATNDTFYGEKFQKTLPRFKNNYLLIVDECHSWGTRRILKNLPSPSMKLGLSATPELYFSEDKTQKLFEFFGGIVAEYTLEDAIRDKRLVEYEYHPILVRLNSEEKSRYDEITKKIVKLIGKDVDDFNDKYDKALEMLLFKRSRIIYGASEKLNVLQSLIDEIVAKGKLLVYCGPTSYTQDFESGVESESITQLEAVNKLLADKNIQSAQYTSKENEFERQSAIDLFQRQTYSTLVAIKCLDEGVDIPIIERAVILASSTNPREFVQRRGRILRPYPGKMYSEIYDFIVFNDEYESLVKKELDRFYEFARIARNYKTLKNEYNQLFKLYEKYGGEVK